MTFTICSLNELKAYKYVIILTQYKGEWLLCRHKERRTWETPGGEIEENEKPIDAAKRKLREETGAESFIIKPIFDYLVADDTAVLNVMVFYAEISVLGKLPDFEIEKISHFKELPIKLTYSEITPKLFEHYKKLKLLKKI